MLVISRDDRCECTDVVQALRIMRDECRASEDYYKEGSPRRWALLKYGLLYFRAVVVYTTRIVDSNGLLVFGVLFVAVVLFESFSYLYPFMKGI